jgi:hypothetical protein
MLSLSAGEFGELSEQIEVEIFTSNGSGFNIVNETRKVSLVRLKPPSIGSCHIAMNYPKLLSLSVSRVTKTQLEPTAQQNVEFTFQALHDAANTEHAYPRFASGDRREKTIAYACEIEG